MYAIYGNIYHPYNPVMLAYIPYMDPMGNAMYFSGSGTTILLDPHVAFSTRRGAVYRVGRPGIVDQWIPPVLYPGVIICGWNGESWSILEYPKFSGTKPTSILDQGVFQSWLHLNTQNTSLPGWPKALWPRLLVQLWSKFMTWRVI